ncbi:MAG TPA: ABC transporter substrate-binding protein [Bradyrhizobium sp.]|nr:ABC transporter substrate-binding protein [Bradyrhizobium sp.]
MRRREFIKLVGGAAAAWPLSVNAQPSAKIPRIGLMVTGSLQSPEARVQLDAFRQGLRQLGYTEGRNIAIEYRGADGRIERFPNLAAELVRLEVDLIFAANTRAALAARQATSTIPIVSAVMGDPVEDGLVASLAQPGGNVTGLTFLAPELTAKRMQLLKDALPNVSRVAALWHPGAYGERTMDDMLKATESAAQTLGVQLQLIEVRAAGELERAFSTMMKERAEALFLFPTPMLFLARRRIIELAATNRLPSVSQAREFVELGGLIAYGANINDLFRRSTVYVDKILKGAKPADLPVEQPTRFELVINLKTAKTLGIDLPLGLMIRADEMIE